MTLFQKFGEGIFSGGIKSQFPPPLKAFVNRMLSEKHAKVKNNVSGSEYT